MPEERLPRKLAAILYADVAGYSRLTGADEDATHRILRAYLDFIAVAVADHSGRIVHYAGDAVLADFGTVLDALVCATSIQRELAKRNAELPDERKVQFRIGVNLGDVIVDREDIYGDGVNVAARLEGLAEPGGICISESVRTAVGDRLPLDFEFMGEQQVKNIERSVRAYHSRLKDGATLPAPAPRASTPASASAPRSRNRTAIVASAIALGAISAALLWFEPWRVSEQGEAGVSQSVPAAQVPVVSAKPEGTGGVAAAGAGAPPGKFLSESEIRQAIVGNTLNFRSPRNGLNMFVFLHEKGGVVAKAEYAREPVTMHTWFFKDGDIFCRTVQLDKRHHCTRVAVGDDTDTLNFVNAKRGVFYQAKVLAGMQVPN